MKRHRIYFCGPININSIITLSEKDSYHITVVLRIKKHNLINIFNETSEWESKIIESHKYGTKILTIKQVKSQDIINEWIHLIYAPLKNTPTSFLITKATELGVSEFTQVITEQTTNKPLQLEKIITKAKEAAQQCGRLSIPKVNPTQNLKNFINTLDYNILWLNEKQYGTKYSQAIKNNYNKKFHILIGPEAGFNNKEYNLLMNNNYISSVYLKGNILRAETAGIAAISCIKYFN